MAHASVGGWGVDLTLFYLINAVNLFQEMIIPLQPTAILNQAMLNLKDFLNPQEFVQILLYGLTTHHRHTKYLNLHAKKISGADAP